MDDSVVRGTTSKQIIEMAREAGARKVYFASAAPPVRHPNVYGIDMPAASELVANGRSEEEVEKIIGADWLVYQDLKDLVQAVHHENANIKAFDTSCFSGEYVTGDVTRTYLDELEVIRSDLAKAKRDKGFREEEEEEIANFVNSTNWSLKEWDASIELEIYTRAVVAKEKEK